MAPLDPLWGCMAVVPDVEYTRFGEAHGNDWGIVTGRNANLAWRGPGTGLTRRTYSFTSATMPIFTARASLAASQFASRKQP